MHKDNNSREDAAEREGQRQEKADGEQRLVAEKDRTGFGPERILAEASDVRPRPADSLPHHPLGSLAVTEAGVICRANSAASRLLAVATDTLIGSPLAQCVHPEDEGECKRMIEICRANGDADDVRLHFIRGDGTVCPISCSCTAGSGQDEGALVHVSLREVSPGVSPEEERELVAELVTQLTSAADLREAVSRLTGCLQRWSGCGAVGVRLREKEDYPYFETRGFPAEFVRLENRLCAYDKKGEVVRDSTGNPVLECMCGNVLCGRVDPAKPFFTEQGSFWSNNTTALLASTSEAERQGRTRNRCNGEGYESVALIPLRNKKDIFGLLQFNDFRPDRFNRQLIAHLERLAAIIALTLSQRQLERRLRTSEAKFRTLAHYAYDMETWRLADGSYAYVSPSCRRVTGYPERAFVDNPLFMEEIVHPEDLPAVKEHFHEVIAKQDKNNNGLEFRIVTPEGQIRWLSHSCSPMYGRRGEWLGRRGSYRDITKRVQDARSTRAQERRMDQLHKKESLERMAGAIVHHVNNKLHVVQVYLQLTLETLPQYDPARYNMFAALDAARKASEVSRHMLTYLGQTTGSRDPLDLSAICREHLETMASHDMVMVKTDLLTPGPIVETDKGQIAQIVNNLIANSRDAVDSVTGEIVVRTGRVGADEIPAVHRFPIDWTAEAQTYGFLSVEDNGRGMNEREIENGFDPFYSTKFTGRGLGLPIVLGLAQSHRGVVTVRSSPGRGSVISVYLPESEKLTLEEHGRRRSAESGVDPEADTVLVVDDDPVVLEIHGVMLSAMGYEVLMASNGEEALELFNAKRRAIKVVVTDYAMPGLNGMELAEALWKKAPALPVILASGYSRDTLWSTEGVRPQFYLGKPFTLQELKEVIARALAR